MGQRIFLILIACSWVLSLSDGVPVGDPERHCPPRHCPPPEPCPFMVPTYYRYNASGVELVCRGCDRCQGSPEFPAAQPERRELDRENQCEDILCAPVPANCKVSATREPAQLVGTDGSPCPVCPVCLDYIANLPIEG